MIKRLLLLFAFFTFLLSQASLAVVYYSDGASGAGADPQEVTDLQNWTTDPAALDYTINPPNFTNPGDEFRLINSGVMYANALWTLTATSIFHIEGGGDFTANGFNHTFILNMDAGATYHKNGGLYTNLSLSSGMSSSANFIIESATAFRIINYPCNLQFTTGTITLTSGASNTINIGGNLIISGGTVRGATTNNGSITIGGSLIVSGGTFTGASGIGSPTFTIGGNLNINTGTYNGRLSSGTPTYTLSSGTLAYGSATINNSLHNITINGTVSTASNFTIGGTLTLTSGTFTISPSHTLTLEGTVTGSGTMVGSSSSNITFQGSGAATLPAITLNTLTINRASSTVTLGGAVTVSTLNLNNGALSIGANTLAVNNSIAQTSGTLTGGSSSNLTFTTSLAGQSIPSATYNNLTLSNTASNPFSVGTGGITVNGTLTLTRDELDNSTNNITFGNGANIIINKTGTNNAGAISASPTFGTSVNVSYTGTGTIISGPELPSSTSVLNNLTINNSAGVSLSAAHTVNGALTLTAGTLTSGGNLTMNLNSGYIANTGTGAISGNITCTKTISRSGYTYLSVPVTGAPSLPASSFFFYYNEPTHDRTSSGDAGWTAISPSALGTITSTNIGRGYSAFYAAGTTNISATGAYAHNTDYSSAIAISKTLGPGDTDTQNGWNLIGNPYPSVLDWDGVRADNASKVDAQCHYYTGSGYVAYAGGVPNSGGNGFIPPMQGVYIKKTNLGSDVLDIRNNRRVNSTKSLLRKSSTIENVLEIQIENGTISDKTYIRLEDSASDGFDPKYDANKLNNTSSLLPNINTIMKDIRLAINTISKDSIKGKMIPLKFTVPASGSFNLRFREDARINEGVKIYLHDKLLNVVQDIRLNPLYNVTVVKGDTTTRYFISFDGEISNVNNIAGTSDISISAHYDTGVINTYFKGINANTADISLINTIGTEVYNKKSANITQGKYSFIPELNQAGIYILKVVTQGKTYTQRILINQ